MLFRSIRMANTITFTDKDLPKEGMNHNKALHITVITTVLFLFQNARGFAIIFHMLIGMDDKFSCFPCPLVWNVDVEDTYLQVLL